jgi:hypothetical protein
MVHVNLLLWIAMLGATVAPAAGQTARWTALIGFVVAALWEQSAVRGFLRRRRGDRPNAAVQ